MKGKTSLISQSDRTSHSANKKKPDPFFCKSVNPLFASSRRPFFEPAAPVQPKLTVNAPGDIYEKEADAVADQVMRMPDTKIQRQSGEAEEIMTKKQEPAIQRTCEGCEAERLQRQPAAEEEEMVLKAQPPTVQRACAECEKEGLQRKSLAGNITPFFQRKETGGGGVPKQLASSLQSGNGGQPLPENTRGWMESRFGADFGGVNIHTNSRANQLNHDLNAKAFTHGSNIYFDKGEFSPGTTKGKRLLAHELTHVVQQEGIQPFNNGFIQRLTCQEEYGPPGSEPEPNALSSQRGAAITRLRSNLNSWDPYLISKVERIANGLFSSEEELAWWGNWSVGLAVDLIDDAIPKPIGTLIKAFASAGEHIANKSIADARAKLAEEGVDAVIAYRTRQSNEGEAYIRQYYEELRSRTHESCAGYHQLLLDSIDEWWPQLDTSALPRARSLAQELMNQVRARHTLERLRREYEQCVEYALYRPGGIPTEEEEHRAQEDCRRETGYYPVTAC